ncbi:MAG: hypothetical protein DRP74_03265 [Candidatus Omnitrophota bacterium]|nr:MAG: hypothetical protein DRP74_03265 [Candidatus Omnitrophota bacterium]
MKKNIQILLVFFLALGLSSCVTAPIEPPMYPTQEVYPQAQVPFVRQDLIHIVAPGETVWRISKMYDVQINDIMRANNLAKPQDLTMGQRLKIPDAAPLRPVIPLFRSNKWKYIIVHHSATDEGNALSINSAHNQRGWKGIGYHFIIDNGSQGKKNGHIEASPRWIKQLDGAHCKANNMNSRGIGVCLVGNFSKEKVTRKQFDSLVYLVNVLRKYYKIPICNIIGHGQVRGARTECPGLYFPWNKFITELKKSGK